MCIGLHVKYPFFVSDFNETELSLQIFEKYSNITFHETHSSGNRVLRADRRKDGQPDSQTDRQTGRS